MFITNTAPPPPKRKHQKRLTEQLRAIRPGQSVVLDPATAAALVSHLRYAGRECRRQKLLAEQVQVWAV